MRIPREFFFEITLAKFIFPNFSPNVGSMQNSATQKDYATQNGYMGHVSTLTTSDTTKCGRLRLPKRTPRVVSDMRVSSRLRAKKSDAERQEQVKRRQEDRDRRGEAHHCEVQGCHKSARHRGSQCDEHFNDNVIDENQASVNLSRLPSISPAESQQNQVDSFSHKDCYMD